MSQGDKRFDVEDAMPVAMELHELLRPVTKRLAIVGSLRRQKETVGDIELLFVPRIEQKQGDLFSTEPYDLAAERIGLAVREGHLQKRPNKDGRFSWGPKNKLAIHVQSGIPVDLFSTTEENWWVSLVVRTGGKENNLVLTQAAQALGRRLNAYGCGVTKADGTVLPAHSEEEVFKLCGVPYVEPHRRR